MALPARVSLFTSSSSWVGVVLSVVVAVAACGGSGTPSDDNGGGSSSAGTGTLPGEPGGSAGAAGGGGGGAGAGSDGDGGTLADGAPLSGTSLLSSLAVSRGALSPAFSPTTLAYTSEVGLAFGNTLTVTPTAASSSAAITVNGAPVTSGTASSPLTLGSAGTTTAVDIGVTVPGVAPTHYALSVSTVGQQAYVKGPNPHDEVGFGDGAIALSADGSTMAIGAFPEASAATGIGGDPNSDTATFSGAVFVFSRVGQTWSQQAYIKASNSRALAYFGGSVALSADGNVMVVGARFESSTATGINGDQNATSGPANTGAAYVFTRAGSIWTQEAYLKSAGGGASFGIVVAISSDGTELAIDDANAEHEQGVISFFKRSGTTVSAEGPLMPPSGAAPSGFGYYLALSGDGNTLAAGMTGDGKSGTLSGAVYIFTRANGTWSPEAYITAANARAQADFGCSVALDENGTTLAVGAIDETSPSTGINGDPDAPPDAGADAGTGMYPPGAAYVFTRGSDGTSWSQQAFIKASNRGGQFGSQVVLSADGNTLAATAPHEASKAVGIGGDENDTSVPEDGAAYTFARTGTTWAETAYVKPANALGDNFGYTAALSRDGRTLAVVNFDDASGSPGINGNELDMSAPFSGAVIVFAD